MRASILIVSLSLFIGCQKSEAPPAGSESKPNEASKPSEKPSEKPGEAKPADPEKPTDPTAGWIDFKGPDESYTAKFPAKPEANDQTIPAGALPAQTIKMAMYEAPGGSKAYVTSVIDFDLPAGTDFDLAKGLAGAADGMITAMNGKVTETKDVTLGIALGKQLAFTGTSQGVSFKGLAHVYGYGGAKPRLFWASSLITGSDPTPEMHAFLEAFKPKIPDQVAGAADKPLNAAVEAGEWVEFEGLIFKAKFPAQPNVQEVPMPTAIGERKMQLAVSGNDEGAYMVGAIDMQVPEGTEFDSKAAIEGAKNGMLKSVAGDVTPTEKDVEMKGLKGKELTFQAPGKGPGGADMHGVARVVIDEKGGKKVYTLIAVGAKPPQPELLARFFDSFEPKELAAGSGGGGVGTAPEAATPGDAKALPPTCQKFIDAYSKCVDAMPESTRGPMNDAIKQMKEAWGKVPADALEPACKQAFDAAKGSMGAVCPGVKWE